MTDEEPRRCRRCACPPLPPWALENDLCLGCRTEHKDLESFARWGGRNLQPSLNRWKRRKEGKSHAD